MPAQYLQLIAGTQEVVSTLVYLAEAGDIPPFTPLMMDANGLMAPWDGTNAGKAIYLTSFAIDSAMQRSALVYKTGVFNIAAINWPKTVDTEQKKAASFAGSGISVQSLKD